MFVIVQCFDNSEPTGEETGSNKSLQDRVARMMSQAGSAISVTTLTDICAFAVGTFTVRSIDVVVYPGHYFKNAILRQVLPAVRSFCVTCAVALASVFLLQLSWFVAWFTLDQRRVEARRNGIVPCVVHKVWIPPTWSKFNLWKLILEHLSKLLDKTGFNVSTKCCKIYVNRAIVRKTLNIRLQ